jgi:uncharacterized membrane protein YeaQ/YmgE (transglycosylase-associated protein family)
MVVVLLLIVIVGSVLATWLIPKIFNSEPPYGTAVDILVGTIVGVIWAIVVFQQLGPLIGMSGWLLLLISAAEGIGIAAVMLWVLRRIKR